MLCPTSACRTCPPWHGFRLQIAFLSFFFIFFFFFFLSSFLFLISPFNFPIASASHSPGTGQNQPSRNLSSYPGMLFLCQKVHFPEVVCQAGLCKNTLMTLKLPEDLCADTNSCIKIGEKRTVGFFSLPPSLSYFCTGVQIAKVHRNLRLPSANVRL